MATKWTANIEVRQHNGQNPYGPWLAVDDDDVPGWVEGLVADEIAEDDQDSGRVEQGGSIWEWRKGTEADLAGNP